MKYITPPYLEKGDQVALVTPAGFVNDEKPIILAEQLLKSWGLVPVRGAFVLDKSGHFGGTDEQRLQEFQEALDNPKIRAVWAVRGGYGSMRILQKLDFSKFKNNPKWIVGFSDITAIHNMLHKLGYKSIHGLMPIQLLKDAKKTERAVESLYKALFGKDIENIIHASPFNRIGSASGIVVGGNLALLQSALGSSYQLKTKGKILFIEDVGEELYRIDRLILSMKAAGAFKNLKGLIVGGFTDIPPNDTPFNQTYQEIILEAVEEYDFPVLFDVPSGHINDNRALVFGEEAIINIGEFVSCIRFER